MLLSGEKEPMNDPEKTYDWQQPYAAAIWEADNLLMEGRISEALSCQPLLRDG